MQLVRDADTQFAEVSRMNLAGFSLEATSHSSTFESGGDSVVTIGRRKG